MMVSRFGVKSSEVVQYNEFISDSLVFETFDDDMFDCIWCTYELQED